MEIPSGVPVVSNGNMPVVNMVDFDYDKAVELAEKRIKLQDRVRKLALQATEPCDWVDEGGKPYLQWSGTAKVAMAFGVSYRAQEFEKEALKDERGSYIMYHCMGTIDFQGRSMSETGSASTRDPFFLNGKEWYTDEDGQSKSRKIEKPLSEIDLSDVRKKAMTNFLGRGLKSMIGLSFSWDSIEDLTQNRINRGNCAGKFQFAKDGKKPAGQQAAAPTSESKQMREAVWDKIVKMNGGDLSAARADLVNRTKYTWEGKEMAGKSDIMNVSEKGIGFLAPKVNAEYASFEERARG
jgi:hypothetical protein